jgi:hypothetical protein
MRLAKGIAGREDEKKERERERERFYENILNFEI